MEKTEKLIAFKFKKHGYKQKLVIPKFIEDAECSNPKNYTLSVEDFNLLSRKYKVNP